MACKARGVSRELGGVVCTRKGKAPTGSSRWSVRAEIRTKVNTACYTKHNKFLVGIVTYILGGVQGLLRLPTQARGAFRSPRWLQRAGGEACCKCCRHVLQHYLTFSKVSCSTCPRRTLISNKPRTFEATNLLSSANKPPPLNHNPFPLILEHP